MIRALIQFLLVLVIGILVYNYFWGEAEEKEDAKKIFTEVKEVGIEIGNLLKAEKEKFDKGKYDDALDKIGDAFKSLKKKAAETNEEYVPEIEKLEKEAESLEKRLQEANLNGEQLNESAEKDIQRLKEDMNDFVNRAQKLLEEIDSDQQ